MGQKHKNLIAKLLDATPDGKNINCLHTAKADSVY
jgi:hypothetical protein